VLKVLEREGIKVEAISGSSVGSIMAVLHAKGLSADEMEKPLWNLRKRFLPIGPGLP